jgi:hypothetical protein
MNNEERINGVGEKNVKLSFSQYFSATFPLVLVTFLLCCDQIPEQTT